MSIPRQRTLKKDKKRVELHKNKTKQRYRTGVGVNRTHRVDCVLAPRSVGRTTDGPVQAGRGWGATFVHFLDGPGPTHDREVRKDGEEDSVGPKSGHETLGSSTPVL